MPTKNIPINPILPPPENRKRKENGSSGIGKETYVAFPTDSLIGVVFARQRFKGGLDDPAAEAEYQVEG